MIVYESPVCPKLSVGGFPSEAISLHSFFKTGILAVAGGIFDQPCVYLEAMTLVANVFTEYENAGIINGSK